MTRRLAAARWIVRHLPRILITDMWQTIVSTVWIVLGLMAPLVLFTGQSAAIERTLSLRIFIGFWGLSLFIGGVAQIIGMHRSDRRTELLGINMAGLGCTIYGLTQLAGTSAASHILGTFFLLIALGHVIALIVSYVARRMGVEPG